MNHRGMTHKHQSTQRHKDVERAHIEIDKIGQDQRRDLEGKNGSDSECERERMSDGICLEK